MKKAAFGIMLMIVVSVGMLTTAFKIQSAKAASGTIYINPDGSITPSTANITSSDNVTYTFTDNNYLPIVVNRSNIVINGNGHTLQASEAKGFSLTDISNVTIRNTIIMNSSWGIFLYSSSDNALSRNNFIASSRYGIELDNSSDNNVLSYNKITSGEVGIELCSSSGNILSDNNVANVKIGICLVSSSGNFLSDNNATVNSWFGILLGYSSSNILSGNSITANGVGVDFYDSSDNTFYHNNFINNTQQVFSDGSPNTWDNGYPSGGNYWSDYQTTYPKATEIDGSGVWNTPYVIDANNTDYYPLIRPWMGTLTQAGQNVTIIDVSGVSLTFSNVTSSGVTTVNETQTGPSPPSGFELATETPTYIDIKTTANYTGVIQLIIPYNSTGLSQYDEDSLCLMHWNETSQQWTDITTRVDTVNHVVYGETSSLSPFAIMLPLVTVTNAALSKPYTPFPIGPLSTRSHELIEDYASNITVTVMNHGSSMETFNVTIYERWEGWGTSQTLTFTDVTLQAGSSATFTTSVDGGTYGCDLSAKVSFTQDGITLSSGTVASGTVSAMQLALPREHPS